MILNYYFPGFHGNTIRGTFTSMIDLHLNTGIDIINISDYRMILLAKKNNNFGLKNFTLDKIDKLYSDDIIIISARAIVDSTYYHDIKFKCKKLIILDSADIYRGKIGLGPDVERTLLYNTNFKYEEAKFLCNPFNLEILEHFEGELFYQKFNLNRISNLHKNKRYKYSRNNKEWILCFNKYVENIGKNIIERLLLDIEVEYIGSNIKDGLYYYLKLLNIDSTKSQIIKSVKNKDLLLKEDINVFS